MDIADNLEKFLVKHSPQVVSHKFPCKFALNLFEVTPKFDKLKTDPAKAKIRLFKKREQSLTIHLSFFGQDDLASATWRVDGQCLLKALLNIGRPNTFCIVCTVCNGKSELDGGELVDDLAPPSWTVEQRVSVSGREARSFSKNRKNA